MSKCIALIHNSKVIIEVVEKIFERVYPNVEIINIMDESLLRDIKTIGCIDSLGTRRILRYVLCAEDMGVDGVLMTCSSLCDAVYASRPFVKVPVFAINEPMAQEAVNTATNIVVVGTLKSVLEPTANLINTKADEIGKAVHVERVLCDSAFEALISGDPQKHDELLLRDVEKAASSGEVIVFAQGSMSRLVPEARKRVDRPILECLESGVEQVKKYFKE